MKTESESAGYFFILYSLSRVFKGATTLSFLCIIRVWSLSCSVRNDMILHFLPILLVKLGFRLPVFWCFCIFSFQFFCSVLNSRSSPKILITFLLPGSKINNVLFNIILILFKRSVEIKEPCYKKTCFQIGFIKKNLICKEKSEIVTEVKLVMKIRKHNHLYFRTLVLALYYSRGDNA